MKVVVSRGYAAHHQDFVESQCDTMWEGEHAVVIKVKGDEIPATSGPYRCISYLDEYIVVSPIQKISRHRAFWKDIVSHIAPQYSRLVERDVNRGCLVQMFRMAEQAGVSVDGAVLVDFGCGDGVIRSALADYDRVG